ncbi:MAG: hypothetical protein IJ899_15210 [Blautia sp.]|nr:hypothetical protein [Blautia sp.]
MKNNLDEMQELQLLKIEHNGCWLAFWLLLISMAVQSFAYGRIDIRTLAGEWIIFMILSIYLAVACVRKGIWDRRIPMNLKSNLIASAFAAICIGIFNAIVIYMHYRKPFGTLAAVLIISAITFVVCLAILTFLMKITEKKRAEMDAEPSDVDDVKK